MCQYHRYVHRKWYVNTRAAMVTLTADHPELFPAEQWENPDM